MQRLLFYSQARRGTAKEFKQIVKENATTLHEEWAAAGLRHVAVFTCDMYVCVYAEAVCGQSASTWDWPVSFDRYLEKWPTEPDANFNASETLHRLAIPMIDVFHDGIPEDAESWRGNYAIDDRVGSIARLKPEMVSSYVYYHYQKQAESPNSFNQTYMIGMHGRLLFSYHELPARVSPIQRHVLLTTKHSPDNWHEVMYPHFDLWEEAPEGQQLWRKMERMM
ncbi:MULTISPECIES: hypothetical protein [unclassified Paenibacillus]|uniref:hypothetical protein n=1 Tax=unclassified Paenibacillus TaxID=185978 RepID=UPI000710A25A|nr:MULTISPECIES: hypothetical protein [unclassified Paenibacillus]KQX46769.1 hypothetical protein ASD40_15880 [Paenibacillus sp. Root444D2]KRE34214.1 hypothetical protein ASG85_12645 [Paenibacillus sp. Soil724D2]